MVQSLFPYSHRLVLSFTLRSLISTRVEIGVTGPLVPFASCSCQFMVAHIIMSLSGPSSVWDPKTRPAGCSQFTNSNVVNNTQVW
jgi:hypothetical protein